MKAPRTFSFPASSAAARALLAVLALALLAGCGTLARDTDAEARRALAPTGTLRVGVYPGSPTSLVVDASGKRNGIALELGQALAERLHVPATVVEFRLVAEVLEAMKAGNVDMTFTNATAARAKDVDFSPPLVALELGYLVPRGSRINDLAAVDAPGVRIGVSQGSSSQSVLPSRLKAAGIAPVPSLAAARGMLEKGELDAFATNKGILFQMTDQLPGSRVLDGRWGEEHMAIAIPKDRDAGRALVNQFAADAASSGLLQGVVARSGLRGTVEPAQK